MQYSIEQFDSLLKEMPERFKGFVLKSLYSVSNGLKNKVKREYKQKVQNNTGDLVDSVKATVKKNPLAAYVFIAGDFQKTKAKVFEGGAYRDIDKTDKKAFKLVINGIEYFTKKSFRIPKHKVFYSVKQASRRSIANGLRSQIIKKFQKLIAEGKA